MSNPFYKAMIVHAFDIENVRAVKNIFSKEDSLKQAQVYIRNEYKNLITNFKLRRAVVNTSGNIGLYGEVGKIFDYKNSNEIKECIIEVIFNVKVFRLTINFISTESGEIRQKIIRL